jgi:hypothetical protein
MSRHPFQSSGINRNKQDVFSIEVNKDDRTKDEIYDCQMVSHEFLPKNHATNLFRPLTNSLFFEWAKQVLLLNFCTDFKEGRAQCLWKELNTYRASEIFLLDSSTIKCSATLNPKKEETSPRLMTGNLGSRLKHEPS